MTDSHPVATPSKPDVSLPKKEPQESQQESQKDQLPTSTSFTYSLSDFWKPSKEPILKWIKDIPSPVRNEPVEPASYSTRKRSLDRGDEDDDSYSNDHRNKRAKTTSAAEEKSTEESHRSKLANSGRRIARRVSGGYQRVITPIRRLSASSRRVSSTKPSSATPTPAPTPSSGTSSSTVAKRPKMRFVFVGDAECGKSSLLLRFYRDSFSELYTPTKYELFNQIIKVNNDQEIDIDLWDTAGDIKLEQLKRLNYLAWDAVFLCFSVNRMRSFYNARTQWITQIRRYTRGAPLILVGTKTDSRVGASLWAPLYPELETRVTATEGAMTATEIGATRYVECSAKTGQGITGVFKEGVRAVFHRRGMIKIHGKKDANQSLSLADFLCFK